MIESPMVAFEPRPEPGGVLAEIVQQSGRTTPFRQMDGLQERARPSRGTLEVRGKALPVFVAF